MNIIYLVIPMSMVIMIIHLISTVLENIKKSRLT
ncbi:MAG: hypothetical protein H0S78_11900 [Tissierellales bacterium]|nr:hypothetical protein [Tissierellales bacterium]